MSLLLEALKKAERAKEEALRKSREESATAEVRGGDAQATAEGVELEPREAKPVLTKDELPDIRQPLEIVTEDLPSTPEAPALEKPGEAPPAREESERANARKVFEAKFREPNPRMPFYIIVGILGAFAIGTVIYFWIELRPPAALVNPNPQRPAEAASAPQDAKAVSASVLPATPAAPSAGAAIPGLPAAATSAPASPAPAAPAAQAASVKAAPAAAPAPAKPAVRRERPRAPVERGPQVTMIPPKRPAPSVNPKVEAAYSAYLAGNLDAARRSYEQALAEDATNHDALLGLAAVDMRSGRLESAEAIYLRLLQLDPDDANAQAALIGLRAERLDPVATESRVKNMLASQPDAAALHFALGNQLARQARWAGAQEEFFKAFSADPANADFAYNLAVSLDHIRQPKLALEYYRRALALAEKHGASFDLAAASSRAAALEK